jgi:hypothetical protein
MIAFLVHGTVGFWTYAVADTVTSDLGLGLGAGLFGLGC